ncbi:MAG: hypothetical protein KGK07_00920 [Chloroflexota bacterium]|nr:hypothetical protein [Chloroflexota bacterium]
MNADLRGQHDLGDIVGLAYRAYGRNFATLLGIALTTVPLQMLIAVVQRRVGSQAAQQNIVSLLIIPAVLVSLLASAALIAAVHEFSGGTAPGFSRAIDAAFERFRPVIATALLAAGLGVLSLAAVPALTLWWLTHPGATIDGRRNWWLVTVPFALTLYLSVRWLFAEQAVMMEGGDRWTALDASADAVRGRWWRTFGIVVVITLIQLGPLLLATAATLAPTLVAAVVTSVVSALVLPFAVTAQTLLYYDLKARRQADAAADRLPTPGQDVPR